MRILVTGARGLLGAEVIHRLLKKGHAVVALLRSDAPICPNEGAPLSAPPFRGAYPEAGGLLSVRGDVAFERLGLEEETYRQLQQRTQLVIHCAAITSFGLSPEKYEVTNFMGTQRVLAFCNPAPSSQVPLLYVSTAYVAGERPGLIREQDLERGQTFGNAYEVSKYKAEQHIRAAVAKGFPAVVARPSIIVGESKTGLIHKFDTLYTVIRLTSAGLSRTLPGDYGATLDVVPVDWVADGLVAAAEKFDAAVGQTLHLVSQTPITLKDINGVCAEFPSFSVPRYVPRHLFEVAALAPVERRYYREVVSLYESYFWRKIKFERKTTQEIFPAPPYAAGPALLRTIFQYALAAKYFGRHS
jgi:nucleoside-diphosphate-sugar epimerase